MDKVLFKIIEAFSLNYCHPGQDTACQWNDDEQKDTDKEDTIRHRDL